MSVLNGNWKVYKDPVFDAKAAQNCFGDSRMQGAAEPAGSRWSFKVRSIEKLLWVLSFVPAHTVSDYRALQGLNIDGSTRVEFQKDDFRVLNELGVFQAGTYKVEELRHNDGYEEFLLSLSWRSSRGWCSEMHALALVSSKDKDIEWDYDDTDEPDRRTI